MVQRILVEEHLSEKHFVNVFWVDTIVDKAVALSFADQLSVGQMVFDQMSVGQIVFDQKTWKRKYSLTTTQPVL